MGLGLLFIVLGLGPLVALQQAGHAAANPTAPKQAAHADSVVRPLEEPAEPPTAEELLKALQRERPQNSLIPPASVLNADPASLAEGKKLWPEGSAIVDRPGRLVRASDKWEFVFDPESGDPPVKFLPNSTLELMARAAANNPEWARFTVSGELTLYDKENFLLARVGMRVPEPKPQQSPSLQVARDAPAMNAPPEDIVEKLRQREPEQAAIPRDTRAHDDQFQGGTILQSTLIPEGTQIVARPGRLALDGEWWTFIIESDHPDHAEPALRLLPCQGTALMARSYEGDGSGLVFVVSGEATLFQGRNYLLPRVAVRRVVSDNLRK